MDDVVGDAMTKGREKSIGEGRKKEKRPNGKD